MAEKENSNENVNKSTKEKFLHELSVSIDAMDTEGIERCLNALTDMDNTPILPENPILFAGRIRTISRKENVDMKPKKYLKIAAVAAVISLMCLTAYATGSQKFFTFMQNGKLITLRTTEQIISEDQAKDFTAGSPITPDDAKAQGAIEPKSEDFIFNSLEQAKQQMDMVLITPKESDEMELESISGNITEFGGDLQRKIVWINYSDEAGRMLGVTASVEIMPPDLEVTSYTEHDIDEGSLSSYTGESGIEFTLLTESDDSGERTAHIATAYLGGYEYSLIFFNFDEIERQAILDSIDLSDYK